MNFILKNQNNQDIDLNSYRDKYLVLYFYPKDNTPGCTTQACTYNLYLSQFKEHNIEILGVSKDSIKSHQNFSDKYNLAFDILVDQDSKLAQYYSAVKKRKTIVFDPQGNIIKEIEKSDTKNSQKEILEFIINHQKITNFGKRTKVLCLLADGFETMEATVFYDLMERAGLSVDLVSINNTYTVTSSHNLKIEANKLLTEINTQEYLILYIPGGYQGVINLKNNPQILDLIQQFNQEKVLISAICAGAIVLDKANILKNHQFTVYPDLKDEVKVGNYYKQKIVISDNIITANGPYTVTDFSLQLIELIKGKEIVTKIKKAILYKK